MKNFTFFTLLICLFISCSKKELVNYNPDYYFGFAKDLLGYYDEETKRTHIFINNGDDMISYEIDE